MNTESPNRTSANRSQSIAGNCQVLAASPALLEIMSKIGRYALYDVPILLTGESGVGKEVLARNLHHKSERQALPFVAVNCAAVPDTMIESEFFGYEKGAFTGASFRHIGYFEQADGGTLFLDEIGDLGFAMQAKLLRAIQTMSIRRLGSQKEIEVDCRIIAATNVDLKRRMTEGYFREDLYYRLAIDVLHIPPLRERPEDIALLTEHLVETLSIKLGKNVRPLEPTVMAAIQTYSWPGNVRELSNVIERAIVLCDNDNIGLNLLGNLGQESSMPLENLHELTYRYEKSLILYALRICKTQIEAAEKLGIPFRTLRDKMSRLGISGKQGPKS